MVSGESWVFNMKEEGSNDVYARFRLKSQVETEEIVNRVSFEFSRLGGKELEKKTHQAMDTKTPLMLPLCVQRHRAGKRDGRHKANVRPGSR